MKIKMIVFAIAMAIASQTFAIESYFTGTPIAPCEPAAAIEEKPVVPCEPAAAIEEQPVAPCEPVKIAPCAPVAAIEPCAPVATVEPCAPAANVSCEDCDCARAKVVAQRQVKRAQRPCFLKRFFAKRTVTRSVKIESN